MRRQRLVVLFVAGVVLLNYPILTLVSLPQSIGGVPVLYVYLFAVWVVLVAGIAWLVERGAADEPHER